MISRKQFEGREDLPIKLEGIFLVLPLTAIRVMDRKGH